METPRHTIRSLNHVQKYPWMRGEHQNIARQLNNSEQMISRKTYAMGGRASECSVAAQQYWIDKTSASWGANPMVMVIDGMTNPESFTQILGVQRVDSRLEEFPCWPPSLAILTVVLAQRYISNQFAISRLELVTCSSKWPVFLGQCPPLHVKT